MNISHDDVVLVGQENFTINTGINGALAAISLDGVLLVSEYANSTGIINMNLGGLVDNPGLFDLVVTGYNAVAYETEITVLAPEGPYLTMDSSMIDVMYGSAATVSINVENVGSDPAENLLVTVSTDDEYVTMIDATETITLDAGASTTIDGFSAEIATMIPNGHTINFDVTLVSGEYSWDYSFSTDAMAPEINFVGMSGDLQPGSTSSVIITLINQGGAEIMYPEISLEMGQYLTASNVVFSGSDYVWPNVDGEGMSGNVQQITADISVSSSAQMGSMGQMFVMIDQLNTDYHDEIMIETPIGQVTADFESGLNLDWQESPFSAWNISSDYSHSGLNSYRSGAILDNQISSTGVTLDVTQAGNIEFWYRVSAEYSVSGNFFYDGLEFYINGQLQAQFQTESDGSSPWKYASFPVSEGETTFTWTFVKDSGGGSTDCTNTNCDDAAFIDSIVFPPVFMESDALVGDANGDLILNILDVIALVNMILGEIEPNLSTSDMNADGIVNVLDITLLLNLILGDFGRTSDATHAIMNVADGVSITADGYIGAVQMTLLHDPGFELSLTDNAYVSDFKTEGSETTLIVVMPEDNQIFTTTDNFEVAEVLVTNSDSFVNVTELIEFSLGSAYPNPFNPTTTIEFSAPEAGYASVKVYNLMGQVVGVLMDGMVDANTYSLTWNAKELSSGIYMIKAESNGNIATQKVMLLK